MIRQSASIIRFVAAVLYSEQRFCGLAECLLFPSARVKVEEVYFGSLPLNPINAPYVQDALRCNAHKRKMEIKLGEKLVCRPSER
jgi:hypothetical protein